MRANLGKHQSGELSPWSGDPGNYSRSHRLGGQRLGSDYLGISCFGEQWFRDAAGVRGKELLVATVIQGTVSQRGLTVCWAALWIVAVD